MEKLVENTLNYDADTFQEAFNYVEYRNLQLLKFGFKATEMKIDENGIVVLYEHHSNKKNKWGAVYLYKSSRGKGLYKNIVDEHQITIVTLKECGIEKYLKYKKINHRCYSHSNAYKFAQLYYDDKTANRSKIPYIYHLDEGGGILDYIGASDIVKDAFYLHPFYQSNNDFLANFKYNIPNVTTSSVALAMEYRHVANSYLSKDKPSDFIGFGGCEEVKQMLIADKVQNYKDFLKHHKDKHTRSNQLDVYFNYWFELLEINYKELVKFLNI